MKIGINCGHTVNGQAGSGAVGYLNESNETRNVGYELMELFRAGGHTVVDCTNDKATSTSANLSKIVSLANAQSLDLFVSIHFNASGGKGTECYTYGGKQHNEAVKICENLESLGFKNRGIKDGSNLYVVKNTKAKAILVEICFVDTKSDAELYEKLGYESIAGAIYEAITGTSVSNTIKTDDGVFTDVPKSDSAYSQIKKLKEYGIVNGYGDGTFKPDKNITRKEMAIMLANTLTVLGK